MPIDILGYYLLPFLEATLRSTLGAAGSDYVIHIFRSVLDGLGYYYGPFF
jgi:hypothetical protein